MLRATSSSLSGRNRNQKSDAGQDANNQGHVEPTQNTVGTGFDAWYPHFRSAASRWLKPAADKFAVKQVSAFTGWYSTSAPQPFSTAQKKGLALSCGKCQAYCCDLLTAYLENLAF